MTRRRDDELHRQEVASLEARNAELLNERARLGALITELETERDLGWARFLRRRIIVNTLNGDAFVGILWDGSGPLVLKDAALLGTKEGALPSPSKLDGEVIIDFTRIAWVQIPTAAEAL